MDEIVRYEKTGAVSIITVNRPEVKNALNTRVFQDLNVLLDRAGADDEVRVLVLTGAGNAFVAGADINELASFNTTTGWLASRFSQSVFNKLERLGKPSIAAINGAALGGGLELALSSTFRVASVTAKMGLPEVGLGIIPAFGGTERLVRTVGYARAAELLLFRKIITAEEALRIGLITETVEPDQVLPRAMEMAQNLAALSPVAVRFELELLRESENAGIDTVLSLESAFGALSVSSAEAKELLGRFLGKVK
jgi:enoyl-CoA hydratase